LKQFKVTAELLAEVAGR